MTASPWKLAAELARPVARGYLPVGHAYAALIVAALQAERDRSPYDPLVVAGGLRHVLGLHLEHENNQRDIAAYDVRRAIAPMFDMQKHADEIFAEAHAVNAECGRVFTDAEIDDIVQREMWWALHPEQVS